MISRIRDGVLYPREILRYAKDKVWVAVLYILFFTLLTGTATIITVLRFDGISPQYKRNIADVLEEFEGDCVISSGVLSCQEEASYVLFQDNLITVYLDSRETITTGDYGARYTLVVHDDSLHVISTNLLITSIPLSELSDSFMNIDFNNLSNGNEELVEEALFTGIDDVMLTLKPYWGATLIGIEFLLNALMLFGFVLISAFFLRKRFMVIPFRDCFVLSTYVSTSIFLLLIFFSLIDLGFFVLLLMLILAFRQNGTMIDEITRRLKKPLDKE